MTADAMILAAGTAIAYAWLCAAAAPMGLALNHVLSTRGARRAWTILLLATGGGVLWTLVLLAAGLLVAVLLPNVALALLLSPVSIPALSLGVILWGVEMVATARVPRIGPAFELETALSLLWTVPDEARALAAEREYIAFLIDEAPSEARRPARRARSAVRRVTA